MISKYNSIRNILILCLVFALASSLQAAGFSDNFETYSSQADLTATAYAVTAGSFTIGSGNGLTGNSLTPLVGGDAQMVRKDFLLGHVDPSQGAVTLDLYFKKSSATSGAAEPQIGLVPNTGSFDGNNDLGGRYNPSSGKLDIRHNGTVSSSATAITPSLATGTWYDLRVTITEAGSSGNFSVTVAVYDSTGVNPVGSSYTASVTDTAISTTAYAGLRSNVGTGFTPVEDNFSMTQASASPTITLADTLTAVNTTYGTASPTPTSFHVSGSLLTGFPGNLTVTPPSGFEVSLSSGSGYSTSLSVPYSSATLASTLVYVRLAATTAVGTYSGNITVSGGGATSQTIATASSTVSSTSPTITLTDTLAAVNTTFGTASPTPTSFHVSAVNLTGAPGNLTVTPPSGFEVSLSSGSGYSTSLSVPYSSATLASTLVYVRLAATTAVGTYSGNITVAGGGDSKTIATASSTVNAAPPSITGAATATAFTTTYGAASTAQSFAVSGANLTANLVATAPTGFEVSSDGTTYGGTATFTQSGGSASGTLRIRLAATATVSGSYNSQNIVLSSTGATSQNITTASTGNTVNARVLTFTGSKTYDASASATFLQLAFANNVDGGNLTMTAGSVTLSSANVGSPSINSGSFSGLTLGGSKAGNYTLTGASGTVTISQRALTFTGSKTYDGVATATAAQLTFGNNLDGGNLTMSGSVTLSSANVGSPSISSFGGLTLGGSLSGNYTLTGASGTVTVSKATPVVTVTVGTYTYNGSPQGPNTYSTSPAGDTGTATWSYVGTGSTTYTASSTPPTAAGTYTATVSVGADSNNNSASSSATAFSILNVNVLFTDNYTVDAGSANINFENTMGREAGSLFPLSYLTRYTGGSAFLQQVGDTADNYPTFANALFLRGDAGVRVDNDFSAIGAPIEIKWSVVMNWYGYANSNSFTIGSRSDSYDPANAAFAFHLRRDGTTAIYDHGVVTAGTSGTNFGENVFVDYKVILSDTLGTGSPFGSGGSKVAYYQGGTLLGTATIGQLTAGQGYIGFVGGVGNVGLDNLQISSVSSAAITLAGTLGAVNTFVGNVSPTPTSFTVSGTSLTGNLTVTPPAGFEVSLSSGSGYTTSLPINASGTLASTMVYVRLAATTALGSYYGNIIVSGGGDAKTIATALSTVSKAPSTITYGSASFTYNGSSQGPSITFSGSTGATTTTFVGTGTTSYSSVNAPANAGTYYVSNTVASDASYTGVTNTQSFTINQATPTISGLTASQSISYGTASVTLSGTVSAGSGYPANGETVSVTINGNTQPATISGGAGGFTLSFPTATILPSVSAYTITYAYAGDVNLSAATSDASTALTVTGVKAPNLTYTDAPGVDRIITLAEIQSAGIVSSQGSPTYTISSVSAATAGGTVIKNGAGTMIKYSNSPTFALASDSFSYTVTDGNASATATVTINFASVAGPAITPGTDGSGHAVISFHGIPGYSYHIQRATVLSPPDWTNAAPVTLLSNGNGSYSWTNTISPADGFYRLSYP